MGLGTVESARPGDSGRDRRASVECHHVPEEPSVRSDVLEEA